MSMDYDPQIYQQCEQFCQKLRRSNQNLYRQFCDIVSPGYDNPKGQLGELLIQEPELMTELNQFLEPEFQFKTMKDRLQEYIAGESSKQAAMEGLIRQCQSGQLDGHLYKDIILELFENFEDLQTMFINSFKKPQVKKVDHKNYFQKLFTRESTPMIDINEILFWDRLRSRVVQGHSVEVFQDLLKILHMYSECIITQIEFMEMIQALRLEKEYIDELRVQVNKRIIERRIQTIYFKPLKDTDFGTSERVTRSYVRMPPGYPKQPSHMLNQDWVSVPFGSEDQGFMIHRKNVFEEQLLKAEDERFEFDVNILQIKRTIKILSQMIEQDVNLVDKVIDMRIIQQVYRNQSQDQNEVLQLLTQKPKECSKIIVKRLKCKLAELETARNTKARQIWDNVQQTNFHRSLDHRSFNFKKNDKLLLNSQRFIREIEEQAKHVLIKYLGAKDSIFIKHKQDLQFHQEGYLNSLFHLTNIRPPLPKVVPIQVNRENARQVPLMYLYFGNKAVLQESLQFIIHYLQIMGGNSFQERKQGTYLLIQLIGIWNMSMAPLKISDFIFNDQQLKQELQDYDENDISYVPEEVPGITWNLQQGFLPKENALTVTQNIYSLVRFIHCVYQRFDLAYSICNQNKKSKRYILFKSALYLSLKQRDFKYEEYLRSLFGKLGFLFSTLEKLLNDTAKQAVQCLGEPFFSAQSDEKFDKFFKIVTSTANGEAIRIEDLKSELEYTYVFQDEARQLQELQESVQKAEKKSLYRLSFLDKTCCIHLLPSLNIIPPNTYTPNIVRPPFLRRNLRSLSAKNNNQIVWSLDDNGLRPAGMLREDFLH